MNLNDPDAIVPLTQAEKRKAKKQIAHYERLMKSFPDDPDQYTPAQKALLEVKRKLEKLVYEVEPLEPVGF
ncbi:MAG: hypothetical protein WCI55_15440 [Armatimonadota bacterium]